MYLEDNFLQLSALQHFIFCPRQCALIHIDQIWEENLFTAEGRILHDNVHEERFEVRAGMRIERGMPLRSLELGLNGKADAIELHQNEEGQWLPFPVEYKRGKPKLDDCDKVQLCAQALCLEEMLNVCIPAGALYYGKTRHRLDVVFNEVLRDKTKDTAMRLHKFISEGKTPKPVYTPKCKKCSLISICMPKIVEKSIPIDEYLDKQIEEV